MTLRDRAFEKSLKRRVRREVAQSPLLRKEAKRLAARQHSLPPWVGRLLISFWLGATVIRLASVQATPGTLVVFAVVVSILEVILLAGQLRAILFEAGTLGLLAHFPIADLDIFRRQWRRYLWHCLGVVGDLTVVYAALALYASADGWGGVALGAGFGVLHGLGAVALGILVGTYRWHPLYQGVGCFGTLVLLLLTIASDQLAPLAVRLLDQAAPVLFCVPPVGWIAAAYHFGVGQGSWIGWAMLLPALSFTMLVGAAYRRLKAKYVLAEVPASASTPGEPFHESTTASAGTPPNEANTEALCAGLKLTPNWSLLGPLERCVDRWLTSRQRHVAWLLTCHLPAWSRLWRRSATLSLVAVLASLTLPGVTPLWCFCILTGMAVMAGLPLLGGNWPGLGPVGSFGVQAPLMAFFPVGFREITRVALKVNLVRTAAFAPQAFLLGTAAANLYEQSLALGLIAAAKLLGAVMAMQPALLALQLSQGSNDTVSVTLRGLGRALIVVALAVAFVGLTIAVMWPSDPGQSAGWLAALAGISLAAWAWYARGYDRGHFDLIRGGPQ